MIDNSICEVFCLFFFLVELNDEMEGRGTGVLNRRQEIKQTKSDSSANCQYPSVMGASLYNGVRTGP